MAWIQGRDADPSGRHDGRYSWEREPTTQVRDGGHKTHHELPIPIDGDRGAVLNGALQFNQVRVYFGFVEEGRS
jgi:hypothetical protein